MKYIIVKVRDWETHKEEEFPIIFPNKVTHADVALIHNSDDRVVTAAGFCRLYANGNVDVWGNAESMNRMKPSRTQDAEIIQRHIRDIFVDDK